MLALLLALQVAYPPTDMAAVQALIPTPASNVPGSETVGGAAGSAGTYRPGNAVQPCISRTASCTLTVSAGIASCTATWDTSGFPVGTTIRLAGSPAVVDTTLGLASDQPVSCKAYSITVTSVSFRCWTGQASSLTLGIVTAGVNLSPNIASSAGLVVQVTGIPSS